VVVFGEVLSVDLGIEVPLLYGLRQFAVWPGEGMPATAVPSGDERAGEPTAFQT
jgi:hypothetical protein